MAPVVLSTAGIHMKTILFVDDDPSIRALLRQLIAGMGYRALEAPEALAALDILSREQVNLALIDVRMPGRDGVWLLDQIVTRFPGTPVALATGLMEMDPHVTLRPGVVGYVVKPFTRQELADVIQAALDPTPRPEPETREIDLESFDSL